MVHSQEEEREHQPVLLKEVIAGLKLKKNGIVVDGTFGRGGHSLAILKELGEEGRLFALDRDPQAMGFVIPDKRFSLEQCNFAEIGEWADRHGLLGKVNGVLLDLGVSSPQLDEAARGFSFLRNGPLDMRMNPNEGISARQWLDAVQLPELTHVLKEYGEERFAYRIAKAIMKHRPIKTTAQLADIVKSAVPKFDPHKHPATRSFQAIRIEVNQELQALARFLDSVLDVLAPDGRCAVISFHSLEDRIVKRFFRRMVRGDELPRKLAVTHDQLNPRMRLVGKAVHAGKREIECNPRARSAVLRIAQKLP